MKMEITVTEALEMINEIRKQPDDLFEMIRTDVRKSVGHYLSELIDTELTDFPGRKRYERIRGNRNHRTGSHARKYTLKGIGKVAVRVPRDRNGDFKTQGEVIPRSRQYEDSLREDLCVIFLSGVSTRTLALISEKLIGRRISATEVSKASKQLAEAVEAWRERDLSVEPIKYMYVDGTLFSIRVDGSIEKVPVLVVIGVTETGHRTVLGLQSGDKESATSWREMFTKMAVIKSLDIFCSFRT